MLVDELDRHVSLHLKRLGAEYAPPILPQEQLLDLFLG